MTVREAFEKAGHPVPGNKPLHIYLWDRVDVCVGYEDAFIEQDDAWRLYTAYGVMGWYPECVYDDHLKIGEVDISNLPAIDAYEALPDVVKAVVPK
jgi:hypothetical protein